MIESPSTTSLLDNFTQAQILRGVIGFCTFHKFGLAVWRLPESNVLKVIVDDSSDWTLSDEPLENLNNGFIFSPFDRNARKYFLKSKLQIELSQAEIKLNEDNELAYQFYEYIQTVESKKEREETQEIDVPSGEADHYQSLVGKAVEFIKKNKFQKVVPSRYKVFDLPKTYDIASHFLALESKYKKSFISIAYTPETNIWLGATPEVLIQTKGQIFKTVALAGTQKYNPEVEISDIAWTQKEIEEQALVARYIINCFKKIRLREFDEHGPKTVIAGNLIHLKTAFTVDMEATNFPQLGSVMLDLLHPTSAICGMPLEASYEFLQQEEGYDRKFFSGYLGPVNDTTDGTSIFVNLRCMEIIENQGILYAGAGVTEDSNPYKEWMETELKMQTLINVLKR